jgi:OOP family OmpA-OmpF porin
MKQACTAGRTALARSIVAILLLTFGGGIRAADIPQHDVPGSHDLSLLPRYQDARIVSYDQADDEEASLPEGRFQNFGFAGTRKLEGRVTRIAYAYPRMLSTIEVMNHYRDVLEGAGFTVAFACAGAEGCGGFNFGELLTQSMVEAHSGEEGNLIIDFLHPVGNDIRYVLATLERPEGRITLALAVARHVGSQPGMFVEAVEQKPEAMATPVASAVRIASALRVQGRIALYNIHFADDRATMRPDSRAVLEQVSAMLHATPAMKLIIVGHSDASGTLAHGMELTAARAQAVVQSLVKNWKVSVAQVTSIGIGPVSPLASNANEAGRALNRRIELVLQ